MTATVSQTATDVRSRALQAFIGQWVHASPRNKSRTLINKNPQAKQVSTIAVNAATNDHTYSIVVNGVTVSYTADSSTSTTEVAQGLVDAVNAEPAVRGQVVATRSSTTIILTGTYPGQSFTVTESESDLGTPSTTTAAATADAVAFGRAIMRAGNSTVDGSSYGKLAKTAEFSAQVDTLTIPYVSGTEITVTVTYRGRSYSGATTSASNADTTITALKTVLNAILPANTVAVTDNDSGSNDATALILTAEIVGEEFTTSWQVSDDGASDPAPSISSTKSASTSLRLAFAGISLWASSVEATTIGATTATYPANEGMLVAESGEVWVSNSDGVSAEDDVYVDLTDGTFTNTSSSTTALLPQAKFSRAGVTSTDGLAAVRFAA